MSPKWLMCLNVKGYITRKSFRHTTVSGPSFSIIHGPNAWIITLSLIHGSHNYILNTFSVAGAETLETESFQLTTGGARPVLPQLRDLETVRGEMTEATEAGREAKVKGSLRTGPSPWQGMRGWSRNFSPGPRAGSTSTVTRTFRWRPLGQMSPRVLSHLTKLS